MRRYNLLVFLTLMTVAAQAQFINLGATVTIQPGATLRVETNIENNGTGTITNNGTIEVSGNFTNAGTATLTGGAGLVKFIGSANTTLDTGGDALFNVEMAKTSNATVALSAPATLAGNLTFTGAGSKIVLGGNDLTVTSTPADPISATVDHPTNGYVVTNGTGKLVKSISANNIAFVHEIGDATNYTPVSSNVTGSYSSATLAARVYTTGLQTKYAGTSDYIDREWNVIASGVTTYANTMTGTYIDGVDRFGSASLVKGATYYSGDWHFDGSAGAGNTVTASVASPNLDVKLSGKDFFGKVNVKAFLQGAYSGGSMTTTLNSSGILAANATTSPYADAFASVAPGFFAANPTIVDWVKIELRDPLAGGTPTSFKASAFIKSNGDVVGLDGISLPVVKGGFPTSVVVLSHRNHLAIRTLDAGLNTINPSTQHNFTTGTGQASSSAFPNLNMADLGGGVFGMWSGDVNGNGVVRYSGSANDNNVLLNTILAGNKSTPINSVYSGGDLNLNGVVRYSGSANDNNVLLNTVLLGNKSVVYTAHIN